MNLPRAGTRWQANLQTTLAACTEYALLHTVPMRATTLTAACWVAAILTLGCGQSKKNPDSTRFTLPHTTNAPSGHGHSPSQIVKPNSTTHTNRLAKEKSPYLLQHAH
ncbi:MAG: hypothetical protein OSB74_08975, partial [Verrucomicrobiota bacterium]|nr:hypothetical protein [Verrucomicrobiota bacterium]